MGVGFAQFPYGSQCAGAAAGSSHNIRPAIIKQLLLLMSQLVYSGLPKERGPTTHSTYTSSILHLRYTLDIPHCSNAVRMSVNVCVNWGTHGIIWTTGSYVASTTDTGDLGKRYRQIRTLPKRNAEGLRSAVYTKGAQVLARDLK